MTGRVGKYGFGWPGAAVLLWGVMLCGCAVPQKPGKGYCSRLVEPQTRTGYWLYLPEDYVARKGRHPAGKKWPMVVTFHGLRPYDDANPQIREWQEEADRYGFVVIAPELRTCDSLTMQFPLRNPELSYVKRDERAVLAILDEVTRRTEADPSRVLATSFSSGGYMAHFMVNRHPERFSCLAVRGSNFSANLLDPAQIPKYRDMKIGIFFGEHDFKVCQDESLEAVEWYRRHRFDVAAKRVGGLGHERKPEVAAALFASTIGVAPKTPPDLGPLVMMDVVPSSPGRRPAVRASRVLSNTAEPRENAVEQSASFSPSSPPPPPATPSSDREPKPRADIRPAAAAASPPPAVRITPRPTATTPKRPTSSDNRETSNGPEKRRPIVFSKGEQSLPPSVPASLRLHGEPIGEAPMWVTLSVELPAKLRDGASVLWTSDDRPLAALNVFETRTVLNEPGYHRIEAHVITADDRKAVLHKNITVLSPASQPAS